MSGTVRRWGPVAGWMAFIFYLSAQPDFPDLGISDWMRDALSLLAHFGLYAVLGFLVCRAVTPRGKRLPPGWLLVLALCGAYALSDEWHQSFVPHRTADLMDWAVDMAGAAAGLLVWRARSEI